MNFNVTPEDTGGFDSSSSAPAYNSGTGTGTTSLDGGDASTADDIQNRMKNFGLLGLFGDNGNAMNAFGGLQGGTNLNDGSQASPWMTDDQLFGQGTMEQGSPSGPSNNLPTSILGWYAGNPGPAGFTGSMTVPYSGGTDGDVVSGAHISPEYSQWLQDQGLTSKSIFTDSGQNTSAFFNKDNQMVGNPRQWAYDPDNAFGLVMAGLAAAGGGFMGGQLLGAAGAGAGAAADPAFGAAAAGTSYAPAGWAAGAAAGAGAGLGGSLASNGPTGEALRNAGVGALTGGFSGGVNLADNVGITDPNYTNRFNNAVMAGGRAALTGGNVGQAVLGSGVQSGLGAALQLGSGAINNMGDNTDTNDDSWNFGGDTQANMSQGPGSSSLAQQYFGGGPQGGMSTPDPNSPMGQYVNSTPASINGYNMATPYSGDTGLGLNISTPNTNSNTNSNPLMGAYKSLMSAGAGAGGKPGNFDSMAGNLLSLWQAHKNAGQYAGLAGNLSSMYGPNSPYAQQLNQQLMRSDAAAGRRSQVGPRNVELQARLAALNSQNAPTLAKLFASQQNNQGQMLMSLLRMGQNPMVGNAVGGLQNLWNPPQPSQNGNGYGGSGTDMYGDGFGPQ